MEYAIFLVKNRNSKKTLGFFKYLKEYFFRNINYVIFQIVKKSRFLNLMTRLFEKKNLFVKKKNFLITYKLTSFPLTNSKFDIIFNYFINLIKKKKLEFLKKLFFMFYRNKKSFIENRRIIEILFQNVQSIISKDSILIFITLNKNFKPNKMQKYYKNFIFSIRVIFSGFSYQYKNKILRVFFGFLKFYLKVSFSFAFLFFQRFIWKVYRIFSIKIVIIKTKMVRCLFFFNNSISGLKIIDTGQEFKISKIFKYQENFLNNHYMFFSKNIYNYLLYFIIYNKLSIKSFNRKKSLSLIHHNYSLISKSDIFLLNVMTFIRPASRFFLENIFLKKYFIKKKKFNLKNISEQHMYFHLSKNLENFLIFFQGNLGNFNNLFILRVIYTNLSNKIEIFIKDVKKNSVFLERNLKKNFLDAHIYYNFKKDIIFFTKNKISFKKNNSLFKIFLSKYILFSMIRFFSSFRKNLNLFSKNFFLFIHFDLFYSTKISILPLLKFFLFFSTHPIKKINYYFYYLTRIIEI